MKSDNKSTTFNSRTEGDIEPIFCYDQPIRKDIHYRGNKDWPRSDQDDQLNAARTSTDIDYTYRRLDHESWLQRKDMIDDDNFVGSEEWCINEDREKENPEKFGFLDTGDGVSTWSDDEEV